MVLPTALRVIVAETAYSKKALQSIQSAPRLAITSYSQLRSIVEQLKEAQPAAEGASPHLVDYVGQLASKLRMELKEEFTKRLRSTIEQMKWPSKDLNLSDGLRLKWKEHVELLLDLQIPYASSFMPVMWSQLNDLARELNYHETASEQRNSQPPVLFPLEVMVHPLQLRFKYHFSGDKPTNRLDKVC
jgi:hypothetical protein